MFYSSNPKKRTSVLIPFHVPFKQPFWGDAALFSCIHTKAACQTKMGITQQAFVYITITCTHLRSFNPHNFDLFPLAPPKPSSSPARVSAREASKRFEQTGGGKVPVNNMAYIDGVWSRIVALQHAVYSAAPSTHGIQWDVTRKSCNIYWHQTALPTMCKLSTCSLLVFSKSLAIYIYIGQAGARCLTGTWSQSLACWHIPGLQSQKTQWRVCLSEGQKQAKSNNTRRLLLVASRCYIGETNDLRRYASIAFYLTRWHQKRKKHQGLSLKKSGAGPGVHKLNLHSPSRVQATRDSHRFWLTNQVRTQRP